MTEPDAAKRWVLAEMNTHHFMFRGAGHSRESARTALLNAWRAHRTALLERYPERADSIPDEHHIEAHFKIYYLDFAEGTGYRDGERIF